MRVGIDVAAFRAFERAGWECAGKAVHYFSAWVPITSCTVDLLAQELHSSLTAYRTRTG